MNSPPANDTIVKEIVIRAPARRVFVALADPRQRVAWWGAPGRFQATHMQSELRTGGLWEMTGNGMGGKPFRVHGEYLSVENPSLLEFTWLADWDDPGLTTLVRFDLCEVDGGTKVRLTHSGLATAGNRERYQGWPWLLSLLQAYVQKQCTE